MYVYSYVCIRMQYIVSTQNALNEAYMQYTHTYEWLSHVTYRVAKTHRMP